MDSRLIRRGFTLVELLVVIAIIGILIALLLPAVQAAREAARRSQCANNVKQIVLALHNYHDTYKSFPFGQIFVGPFDGDPNDNDGGSGFGWSYSILPYIEQNPLFEQFDPTNTLADTTNSNNGVLAQTFLPDFSCPSDAKPENRDFQAIPQQATTSYEGCSSSYDGYSTNVLRDNGLLGRSNRANGASRMRDVQDGTSNTFAIAEVKWKMNNAGINFAHLYGAVSNNSGYAGYTDVLHVQGQWAMNWTEPEGNGNSKWRRTAGSEHPGGAQFGFTDGSVRFVSETIQHTATAWINNANAFDRPNNGAGYGTYQRLFSMADELPVSGY